MIDQNTLTYDISKNNISDYSNNHYNTFYIMTSDYARKLSTDTLTNRLHKQPFNATILNELNKRATKVFKCEIQAKIRLEKELAKRSNRAVIGYKNEAYDSEENMLNGVKVNYEDLSPSEKAIYNRL